jgi:hypothetical protein
VLSARGVDSGVTDDPSLAALLNPEVRTCGVSPGWGNPSELPDEVVVTKADELTGPESEAPETSSAFKDPTTTAEASSARDSRQARRGRF